ncbi:MAG: 50S ribosomal protein L24 [Chitinophagales bacterium]|nr:50S ribosomal protein L24 [Bacteroidota bacterium]MCB9255934.1 50S ribosomal protein L24 [Chitinophagales bacterium]
MSNNRFEPKFKVKKGDTVIVLTGNDKGKTGKVLSVLTKTSKVFVEGVAMIKKHQKPDAKNPDGGIIEKEAPIHISNVSLIDPKSGKATRVAIKRENGNVQRIAKKSGEVI